MPQIRVYLSRFGLHRVILNPTSDLYSTKKLLLDAHVETERQCRSKTSNQSLKMVYAPNPSMRLHNPNASFMLLPLTFLTLPRGRAFIKSLQALQPLLYPRGTLLDRMNKRGSYHHKL